MKEATLGFKPLLGEDMVGVQRKLRTADRRTELTDLGWGGE